MYILQDLSFNWYQTLLTNLVYWLCGGGWEWPFTRTLTLLLSIVSLDPLLACVILCGMICFNLNLKHQIYDWKDNILYPNHDFISELPRWCHYDCPFGCLSTGDISFKIGMGRFELKMLKTKSRVINSSFYKDDFYNWFEVLCQLLKWCSLSPHHLWKTMYKWVMNSIRKWNNSNRKIYGKKSS